MVGPKPSLAAVDAIPGDRGEFPMSGDSIDAYRGAAKYIRSAGQQPEADATGFL